MKKRLFLIVFMVLMPCMFSSPTKAQPVRTYQVHLPVLAQDSPWREPVGFKGRCFGWYENRERHGWYCARAEQLPDRVRVYGAAVVNGEPLADEKLVASSPDSWCFGVTGDDGRAWCDIKYVPRPVTVRVFVGNVSFRINVD